jgi:addiction module HigA family antidote
MVSKMRMKSPPHPGAFVKAEIIEAHGLTVTGGAKALGVSRQALSELLNGHTAISSDMAVRLEKAFGVSMDTLLRMQASYEIAQARARADTINVKRFVAASEPTFAEVWDNPEDAAYDPK